MVKNWFWTYAFIMSFKKKKEKTSRQQRKPTDSFPETYLSMNV